MNPKCKKDYSKVPKVENKKNDWKNTFSGNIPRKINYQFKVGDIVKINEHYNTNKGHTFRITKFENPQFPYLVGINNPISGTVGVWDIELMDQSRNFNTVKNYLGIEE